MKDLFTLFAPVKIIKLCGEFLMYFLKSFFTGWRSFIIINTVLAFIIYQYLPDYFLQHYFIITIFCFSLASLPELIKNLKRDLRRRNFNTSADVIIINECLIIKVKEYIDIDFDAQDIRIKLSQQINYIQSHFTSFKIPFLSIELPMRKRIFYLLKDVLKLKSFLLEEVESNKALATLLIIKDDATKKIEFDVIQLPIPDFDIINTFIDTFSNFDIANEGFNKEYIIEVSKIFLAIYATGSINLHDIGLQHKILDDNQKIMMSALDVIIDKIKPNPIDEIMIFKKGWLCEFERIRSIVLINQKEYYGAIRHLFNAIRLKPFHPYKNYDEYKEEYTLKYVSEILAHSIKIRDEIELSVEEELENTWKNQKIQTSQKENDERRKYPQMPLYQEIITQIIKDANSEKINKMIEAKLSEDFCESPLKEIIKGDSIKYIPLPNSEKYEKMYLDRCPEVIKCFNRVLELDPNFPYMNIKLASVMFIYYSNVPQNESSEFHLHESMEIMQKGVDMFARLGIDIRI